MCEHERRHPLHEREVAPPERRLLLRRQQQLLRPREELGVGRRRSSSSSSKARIRAREGLQPAVAHGVGDELEEGGVREARRGSARAPPARPRARPCGGSGALAGASRRERPRPLSSCSGRGRIGRYVADAASPRPDRAVALHVRSAPRRPPGPVRPPDGDAAHVGPFLRRRRQRARRDCGGGRLDDGRRARAGQRARSSSAAASR